MRSNIVLLLASTAVIAPAAAHAAMPSVQQFHEDHVLGSSLDVTVVAESPDAAILAHAAVKAEIARLDSVLSAWRADSEISALNTATVPTQASPDLQAVLKASEAWRDRSGGAFSARLGLVEQAWRDGEATGLLPAPKVLSALATKAQLAPVSISGAGLVTRPPAVVFAVDGIAKGYVIDAALRAGQAASPGVRGLMVDIGGDMRCAGASPSSAGWRVGIAAPGAADNVAPVAFVALKDKAIATSGMGQRDRSIGGCAYSHTLSPFDGSAVSTPQVTVVADRAADADALASALSVLPVDQGLALIERTMGAEARIVRTGGLVSTSSGWNDLLQPSAISAVSALDCAAPAAATVGKAWPAEFGLTVSYTIPQLNDPRHPPFVAIWITDKDGKMVRTLFHLGDRPPRYLNSNYVWWSAFQKATPNLLTSVTRPTRRPGAYDASWDGKDDSGAAVGQGDYVIHIEASREHGGHSLQEIPIKLGSDPATASANGGGELGGTKVTYGKAQ